MDILDKLELLGKAFGDGDAVFTVLSVNGRPVTIAYKELRQLPALRAHLAELERAYAEQVEHTNTVRAALLERCDRLEAQLAQVRKEHP